MPTLREVIAAWVVGAGLWCSGAVAADAPAGAPATTAPVEPSGVLPGDDALTCDQIYAQATAESQRDQQDRARRNEQMRAQGAATGAVITGAMATGGLFGTGQAAQAAAEAQVARQTAMLGAPQANPRMQHLKQLWAQKQCVMK